jgi:hypothetical protein
MKKMLNIISVELKVYAGERGSRKIVEKMKNRLRKNSEL